MRDLVREQLFAVSAFVVGALAAVRSSEPPVSALASVPSWSSLASVPSWPVTRAAVVWSTCTEAARKARPLSLTREA